MYRNGISRENSSDSFTWSVALGSFKDENEKSVAFSKTSSKEDRYATLRRAAARECIRAVGGGTVSDSSIQVILYFFSSKLLMNFLRELI